jgi:hypothetical protein
MKYTVEFELQSDVGATIGKTVESALKAVSGSIHNLRIVPMRTYYCYIQGDEQTMWAELRPNGSDE